MVKVLFKAGFVLVALTIWTVFTYIFYILPGYTNDTNEIQIATNEREREREGSYQIQIPSFLPPKTPITLHILWWKHEHWEETLPPKYINDSCLPSEVQCFYETDKSTFTTADYVVFFPRFPGPYEADGIAKELKELNEKRPHGQSWILHTLESPLNDEHPRNANFMRYFNFTSNYQLSSDIPDTYFYQYMWWRNLKPDYVFGPSIPVEQKTKEAPIAWYASNCGSKNGRENIIKELQKYIKIHSYGKCLNNMAEKEGEGMWEVLTRYKFYLVFENSGCEDYVTEKFWRTLHFGLVPVVYGAPDFTKFEPTPKSVIKVSDYPTLKELADYLHYLDNNDTAYNEYLTYKTDNQLTPSFYQLMNSSPCNSVFGNICKFAAELAWGYKVVDRTNGLRADTSCNNNVYYA